MEAVCLWWNYLIIHIFIGCLVSFQQKLFWVGFTQSYLASPVVFELNQTVTDPFQSLVWNQNIQINGRWSVLPIVTLLPIMSWQLQAYDKMCGY